MAARIIHTNFTAGEVSPRLKGRVDIDRYPNACEELYNFQVLVHGGAARRPGSYYVTAAKSATATARLRAFKVSAFASYVLEFSAGFVRFYRNRGPVEDGLGPVELVMPYAQNELSQLRFAQSKDVLFITHENHPPRKIQRTDATTFTTAEVVFENGPWENENVDSTVTMTPSAANVTGSVTITASAPVFTAADIGRKIALYDEAQRVLGNGSTTLDKDEVFYYDDRGVRRLYRVVKAGTVATFDDSGTTPPYNLNGLNDEGPYIQFGSLRVAYIGRGKSVWGWGTITGYTSPTVVTVNVPIPFENAQTGDSGTPGLGKVGQSTTETSVFPNTDPTTRWRMGAWGATQGYPRTICFYQQRTWWGGNIAQPQTLWSSQSGDFYNMAPTEPDGAVLDTNAITFALDDDESNSILWLLQAFRGISIGTASGEFLGTSASSANQAISPTNFLARRAGDRGSAQAIAGQRVGNVALFVQRGGRKVREMAFDLASDSYKTTPASLLSEHITGLAVTDMALQEEPEGTLWLSRSDGLMGSLTYDGEQQVRGWARHELARTVGALATVESMATVPSPDGATDDVYLLVRRVVGGATVRYIEVVRAPFRSDADGEDGTFFVDCGLTYDGAPETDFTGLDHLEGETVQICADGAYRGTGTVVAGAVSIEAPAASVVHIGLGYESRLTPVPVEAGAQGGTAQNALKKTTDLMVQVYESRGGEAGDDEGFRRIHQRAPQDDVNAALPLVSRYLGKESLPGGWTRDGKLTIRQTEPLPMTVLSIVRTVTTSA